MNPIVRLVRNHWVPLLVLLVAGSIPFMDFLLSPKMLYGSDQIGGFGNFFQYQRSLRSFEIPGWHPWYLSGMPTLDAIAGDLPYPPFWLAAWLLPVHKMLGFLMWGHVLLAGLGAYLLARRSFALDRWSATFLGGAYMLNLNLVSIIHGGHTAKVYIQAWLPFGIHFLLCLLGPKARWWHPLGLAATIGLMISTSHLQMTYYALIAYGVCFLWTLWEILRAQTPLRERLLQAARKTGSFWAAILLGVALALPVLMPPMKYVKEFSVRNTAEKTSFEHATSWSLHPEEIGSLAFPEFSGFNETYWGRNAFKLNAEYAGIAITVLGLAAAFAVRSRATWFWATIAVLSLLNALGAHTPFYRLIYDLNVPGIRNFRAASMVMFLWAASLVALSALWLRHLATTESWKQADREKLARKLWIAAASVGGTFLLIALAPAAFHDLWMGLFSDPSWPAQNLQNWGADLGSFRTGALRTAVLGAGVLALSAVRVSGNLPAPGMAVALGLITLLDLLPLAPNFVKTFHRAEYYPSEPVLESIATDTTTFRVADLPGSVGAASMLLADIETMGGFADNEMAHMQEFRGKDWQRTMAGLVQNPDGTVQGSRILDLLNAKYILFRAQQGGPLSAAINRSVLPRARLVDKVLPLSLDAQKDAIFDSSFDHTSMVLLDPKDQGATPWLSSLAVQKTPAATTVGDSATTPVASSPGEVSWTRQGTDAWTFHVKASKPSLLVLSEPWYPHWQATIDGREVPVLRANFALRAIPVEAGDHRIEMVYHSPWVRQGMQGMVLAFGALLLWGLAWWLAERRRSTAA